MCVEGEVGESLSEEGRNCRVCRGRGGGESVRGGGRNCRVCRGRGG